MNYVGGDRQGKITSDRSRLGRPRISVAYESSQGLDSIRRFQHHQDDRSRGYVAHEFLEEWLTLVNRIQLLRLVPGDVVELEGFEREAFPLESA